MHMLNPERAHPLHKTLCWRKRITVLYPFSSSPPATAEYWILLEETLCRQHKIIILRGENLIRTHLLKKKVCFRRELNPSSKRKHRHHQVISAIRDTSQAFR
ncbi:hypothetical protein Ocin01_17265 [Orchesella cincta]|uniref:Uncharacterized protein n=1 Tax=Orchesella cincta TaxID=48709 RepID=A0A1D2M8V2_ORCCI|nr:hypothetical protein Ocin01_17265 [Orchesella cincta]